MREGRGIHLFLLHLCHFVINFFFDLTNKGGQKDKGVHIYLFIYFNANNIITLFLFVHQSFTDRRCWGYRGKKHIHTLNKNSNSKNKHDLSTTKIGFIQNSRNDE